MTTTLSSRVRQWVGDKNPYTIKGSDFPGWDGVNRETVNSCIRRMRSEWDKESDAAPAHYIANPHAPAMTARAQAKLAALVASGTAPDSARQMVRSWWPEAAI